MRILTPYLLCLVFTFTLKSAPALGDHNWTSPQQVAAAGKNMYERIKKFDHAITYMGGGHDVKVLTRHLKDVIWKFRGDVLGGVSYSEAVREFEHIHEDFHELEDEVHHDPKTQGNSWAKMEWPKVGKAFHSLKHHMFEGE